MGNMLKIQGVGVDELAQTYGTPLYVMIKTVSRQT